MSFPENCFLPTPDYDEQLILPRAPISISKIGYKKKYRDITSTKLEHSANCLNNSLCEKRSLDGRSPPLCGGRIPNLDDINWSGLDL